MTSTSASTATRQRRRFTRALSERRSMKSITTDSGLVAYCGLYCGACQKYLRERCEGCHNNTKAAWCKVRSCNLERHYSSCAECVDYPNAKECKKFNNAFSKVIGFVLRSDRAACIKQIKDLGLEDHAEKMARLGRQSIRP
jgi:hypothetical protein